MSQRGSVEKRCGCSRPDGKRYGRACPKLKKQDHGSWTAYWSVPGPDGNRRQRSKGGFPTKRAAAAFLTATLGAVQQGSYADEDRKITVARFLHEHWLPAVRSEATASGEPRRSSTVATYETAAKSWIEPHLGGERLVGLTPGHVERWLATLAASGGKGGRPLGGRGCQVAYTVLRAALAHAVRRGFVRANVVAVVGRPGHRGRQMTCWTAEAAQQFLSATVGTRLYPMWALFLARGPRRGELAGLRWDDVDLDAGRMILGVHTRVSVNGHAVDSTAKTRAGRRAVPLDAGLVAVLRAHRRQQLAGLRPSPTSDVVGRLRSRVVRGGWPSRS